MMYPGPRVYDHAYKVYKLPITHTNLLLDHI